MAYCKKMVVAFMLTFAFIGAIFIIMSVLRNNESVVYNNYYSWHAEMDPAIGIDILIRGNKID